MRRSILAVLLLAAQARLCLGENATSAAITDPLTETSRLYQLTKPNGGVTGIRIDPSGKVVQIEAVDFAVSPVNGIKPVSQTGRGTLDALKPHQGLLAKPGARAAKGKTIAAPKAQAEYIETSAVRKW